MGKFIESATEGLGIYPAIAFVIFSLFFLVVLFMTFTRDKDSYSKLKNIPFVGEENEPKNLN